jgi:hypothetical protein
MRVMVEASGVRVRAGFPWWLRPLLERSVIGVALGRTIYVSRYLEGGVYLDRLVRHELAHLRQMREEGLPRFLYLYFRDYVELRAQGLSHTAAYLAIPFEIEARRSEMEAADASLSSGRAAHAL